ncbi:MAG TPA: inositol monophosphatase family protein, partial [Victivallales bacterium]|nr:inositol monophosphatase family protein [Victivallales bacterium]
RNKKLILDYKNGIELVTSADIMSDKLIREEIYKHYPEHKIYSEEFIQDDLSDDFFVEPLWIIDPIDGTVNYAHGHYQVAISIAFAYGGQLKTGVVYNPFLNETFTGIRDKGSWLNGVNVNCSKTKDLKRAIIGTGFPYEKDDIGLLLRRIEALLRNCQGTRRLGSAALDICWVASGRLDGYYETIKLWDFAAAYVIARESGARLGNINLSANNLPREFNGNDFIVENPDIYDQLVNILK